MALLCATTIMSQYYVPQPQQSISRERSQEQEATASNTWDNSFHLVESAVYIFPNPSSAPPSPSQSSDFSAPTDFTISAIDFESGASDRRPPHSNSSSYAESSPLSETSDLVRNSNPWEWTPDSRPGVNARLPIDLPLVAIESDAKGVSDQWHVFMHPHDTRMLLDNSHSACDCQLSSSNPSLGKIPRCNPSENLSSKNPNKAHPLQFPLLSFFVSLLCIDQSTVDLVTSPSTQSFLFPGTHLLQLEMGVNHKGRGHIDEKASHGVRKLLTCQHLQPYQSLRDGLNVVADYSSDTPSSLGLLTASIGLWELVTGFVANSGNALRQAFRPSSDD
ncbi:hypothetical protein BDZ97DRAFT_1919090 [Flammula alnicola]|nr:hypothetical protein BDZ97DRAFT_1919090 [Flammula alnicola]